MKSAPSSAFGLVSDQMNTATMMASKMGVRKRFVHSRDLTPLIIASPPKKQENACRSRGQ